MHFIARIVSSCFAPRIGACAALVGAAFASPIASAEMEAEVTIWQSAAGQLVAELHADQPILMEESIFPEFAGYATGSIGFHSADFDEPRMDRFMLAPGSDIEAVLVGFDPGIQVYKFPNFMVVGDVLPFGTPSFDYHPVFNIPVGAPGELFEVRFVLRDRSGSLADSEELSIQFTPVPAPAALVAVLMGALVAPSQRRRPELREPPPMRGG